MEVSKIIWVLGAVVSIFVFREREVLKSVFIGSVDASENVNVRAFLGMIRSLESRGEYNVLYGGGHFSDYSKHPNVRVPFHNPLTNKHDYSTAAGAYQIIFATWNGILEYAGDGDFSPASQDAAAIWLLKLNGSLDAIVRGDIDLALEKSSKTWASLPYTTSKQRHVSAERAIALYQSLGGSIA